MRGRYFFASLVLGWALLVLPLTGGCSRTQEKTPTLQNPEQANDPNAPKRAGRVKPGGDSPGSSTRGAQTPP